MSIVDSKVDREAAEAELRGKPDVDIRRDLEYWALKRLDHMDEHDDLASRLRVVETLYTESAHWVAIIAEELRRRRDVRRPH